MVFVLPHILCLLDITTISMTWLPRSTLLAALVASKVRSPYNPQRKRLIAFIDLTCRLEPLEKPTKSLIAGEIYSPVPLQTHRVSVFSYFQAVARLQILVSWHFEWDQGVTYLLKHLLTPLEIVSSLLLLTTSFYLLRLWTLGKDGIGGHFSRYRSKR